MACKSHREAKFWVRQSKQPPSKGEGLLKMKGFHSLSMALLEPSLMKERPKSLLLQLALPLEVEMPILESPNQRKRFKPRT